MYVPSDIREGEKENVKGVSTTLKGNIQIVVGKGKDENHTKLTALLKWNHNLLLTEK